MAGIALLAACTHIIFAGMSASEASSAAVADSDSSCLRLGQCCHTGRWQLCNILTGGQCQLPDRGPWWVEFADDDGSAELFSEEADLKTPAELLDKSVYVAKSDGRYIVQAQKGGDSLETYTELNAMKGIQMKATLVLSYATSGAEKSIGARLLPHCGLNARIFILAKDIYNMCGLKSARGSVSRWFGKGFSKWSASLRNLGLAGHLQSKRHEPGSMDVNPGPALNIMLNSASIVAVFALAATWTSCSPQQGGLRDEDARATVHAMLASLLIYLHRQGDLVLKIFLDDQVCLQWPQLPTGRFPVSLTVSPGGVVDLSKWQATVCYATPPWLSHLGLASASTVDIMSLVCASCRCSSRGIAAALWQQLVHAIGSALDQKLCNNKVTGSRKQKGIRDCKLLKTYCWEASVRRGKDPVEHAWEITKYAPWALNK